MFDPKLHWVQNIVPHRLALTSCPIRTIDLNEQVATWRDAGVEVVASLLELREADDYGVAKESTICETFGIEFLSFPIPDHGIPRSEQDAALLIDRIHASLIADKAVAIHCYAGIGRTGIIAACVLNQIGIPVSDVFDLLHVSRGCVMPESYEQREWVKRFIASRADAP